MPDSQNWLVWALLSAVFAAATAILAKIGLEGIDSDYATLVRTTVILVVLGVLVYATGKWQNPATVPGSGAALSHALRTGHRSELGLLFSGAQGGRGVEGRAGR